MQTKVSSENRVPVLGQGVSTQSKVVAGVCAALLGVFILWGVGFAQSATLHNAAHDGRHSFSFPCH